MQIRFGNNALKRSTHTQYARFAIHNTQRTDNRLILSTSFITRTHCSNLSALHTARSAEKVVRRVAHCSDLLLRRGCLFIRPGACMYVRFNPVNRRRAFTRPQLAQFIITFRSSIGNKVLRWRSPVSS